MRVRAALVVALLVSACAPSATFRRILPPDFPHEEYAQSLRQAGLDQTALGREWLGAAERALRSPLSVTLPYRETGYFSPAEPGAVTYGFDARRGQRLRVDVELETSEAGRMFIDLFREGPGRDTPKHVASAAAGSARLEVEVADDGRYLLRLQPELLRGGRYTLTQQAHAALRFPVLGKDSRAVGSGFGAERDGGRREHHGIDILAPRGSPVLSASDGVVTSVAVTDIGGKIVWVWDSARGLSLYYAHLDSQSVSPGSRVGAGEMLGTVGNTGNARTTAPHLHFGLYDRRVGPIDPMPFVHEPAAAPAPPAADASILGAWHRIDGGAVALVTSPTATSAVLAELPRTTAILVQGATATSYRVRLPDGRAGFVPAARARNADVPLRSERRAVAAPIRDRPLPTAAVLDYTSPDHPVPVLASFDGYLLVRTGSGRRGWLARDGDER
jgi:murein DD-endopeptidase MepM/ murein hydrolase activator NlpD